MNKIFWVLLAFMAGAVLPIQAGLNAKLGKAGSSAIHASMISFAIGLLGLILYILITQQNVSIAGLKATPIHVWLGGVFGAFYVSVVILAFPHLGPGLTFGLIIAGQLIISLLLEHFNILVAQASSLNIYKIAGAALIILGVVIIKKN